MPTVLKMLLTERHLKTHRSFLSAYDLCAAQLEPPIPPGRGPKKAQYYQWLSGRIKGLPLEEHCRVLATMFPDYTVEQLFQVADSFTTPPPTEPMPSPGSDTELQAFLGSEMVSSGTTLVYPTFELAARSVRVLADGGVPRQHIYSKEGSAFSAQHRIDVPVALAENDVRGLLYVLTLLQRQSGIATSIQSDRDVVTHCDRPYISFGLSSNDCTHMYIETVKQPLFTIRDSPDGGQYLECLELADGSQYRSDDNRNIGIIARVRPSPVQHPDRYWIYCAGLGPRGTTGASWYLANYWSTLHKRVDDREFVAVVTVRRYSDETANLEHLMIDSTERA